MGFFSSGYDKDKLKSNLKMAVTRINLAKNKKVNLIKVQKREIADLLRNGKDESARIKVENVIREEYTIEAFELIELFCELLQARQTLINESKNCPSDLKEAVSTIIYAAPRMEVKELLTIRDQLGRKFGRDFYSAAAENKDLAVNQRVMFKLGVKVPEPYLCVQYLKDIAREHNVDWNDESAITAVEMPIMGGGHGGSMPPPPNGGPGPGPGNGGGGGGQQMNGDMGGMAQQQQPQPPQGGFNQPQQPYPGSQDHQFPGGQQPPPQQYNNNNNPGQQSNMGYQQPSPQQQQPPQQPFSQYDTKSNGSAFDNIPNSSPTGQPGQMNFGNAGNASNGGGEEEQPSPAEEQNDSGMAYDFDDLQRRFDALKNRE
eukprot:gb/GECH01009564.1/.p1 GENE.gb/GECH01009564.1/~~gb/GECH01009564.1/.p1  ORF type:complete len:372 (+),score=134.21 gb/GECH01009564.1/:1-1116(+)